MNKIITKKIDDLQLDESIKDKVLFLLDNGFDVYFSETKDFCTMRPELSTWFIYEKEGIFATYHGRGAGFSWLKSTSTVHRPNTQSGSGWQVFESEHITNEQLVKTWEKSKLNILSNKEQNFDKLSNDLHFWNLFKVEA